MSISGLLKFKPLLFNGQLQKHLWDLGAELFTVKLICYSSYESSTFNTRGNQRPMGWNVGPAMTADQHSNPDAAAAFWLCLLLTNYSIVLNSILSSTKVGPQFLFHRAILMANEIMCEKLHSAWYVVSAHYNDLVFPPLRLESMKGASIIRSS